ncbi:hypothetical protein PPSIR1_25736 [Plesiocystis pacifica SIR-1]|uniref:Uncharacterized protein n=1 Tax=Plesiocystis pacifica SIR-1 TaxID=391625 RepID=A6FZG1_9BACT|nr:hypothetical protein [Plesiocystis pacifica]EDM81045.1 hypothetical protein PPSIR1_25736 [Plesiocystis pacifica SIR-1]
MSVLEDEVVELAWTNDARSVGRRARRNRISGDDPLGFAMAGVELSEGINLQVGGYRPLSHVETFAVGSAFRATRSNIAVALYAAHPELAKPLEQAAWAKNKLERGRLKRLGAEALGRVLIYNALLDVEWVDATIKAGKFEFDTHGEARTALAVSWLWQRTHDHHAWPTPTLPQLHAAANQLIAAQARAHSDQAPIMLAKARADLAWTELGARGRSEALSKLDQLGRHAGKSPRDRHQRLLANGGRLGAGLRLRDRNLTRDALSDSSRELGAKARGSRLLESRAAWSEAIGGSRLMGIRRAQMLERGGEASRFDAAMIYDHLGRGADKARAAATLGEAHSPKVSKLHLAKKIGALPG